LVLVMMARTTKAIASYFHQAEKNYERTIQGENPSLATDHSHG
jgi:hypothetical protein